MNPLPPQLLRKNKLPHPFHPSFFIHFPSLFLYPPSPPNLPLPRHITLDVDVSSMMQRESWARRPTWFRVFAPQVLSSTRDECDAPLLKNDGWDGFTYTFAPYQPETPAEMRRRGGPWVTGWVKGCFWKTEGRGGWVGGVEGL